MPPATGILCNQPSPQSLGFSNQVHELIPPKHFAQVCGFGWVVGWVGVFVVIFFFGGERGRSHRGVMLQQIFYLLYAIEGQALGYKL